MDTNIPNSFAPLLLTRSDAAKALCLCERSVDALVRRGELASVRIGRRVLFRPKDLEDFVEGKRKAA